MSRHHLKLATEKNEAVLLRRERGQRKLNFLLDGHLIGKSAKYLEVVMETGLVGIAHVRYVAHKVTAAANHIPKILPTTHGASENERSLLSAVAE